MRQKHDVLKFLQILLLSVLLASAVSARAAVTALGWEEAPLAVMLATAIAVATTLAGAVWGGRRLGWYRSSPLLAGVPSPEGAQAR